MASFLSKLGNALRIGLQISNVEIPLIAPYLPANVSNIVIAADNLANMGNVVITTEQMFANTPGVTGEMKLQAASPFVAQIVQQMSLISGKKILDPAKFQAAVKGLTSNMADLLNSVE